MILSLTNARGMTISFLKHVENDLSMLSCHLYKHLTYFHHVLIANQNYHTQLPKYNLIHFLFYLLDINISFVLSIFTIKPFCRHQILSKFKECCSLFSKVPLPIPILYNVVSSAYKSTDRIKFPINRGKRKATFNCL